jgi:RNA polymerase sigma-70 factor, ECF subfamily
VALRQDEFQSLCDDVDLDRDRALVERCQAGDSAAFGNLYARYYERLLRFCMRRLNDRHEAEDAAQEAFARAWKALPNFAGERRFYPWLTVIAGNICTDMLRRRSRSTPTDDVELGSHQPFGGSGAETSEELVLASVDGELVNRALGRLSTRHRHVLAMREGSGWTYQQIADHEGVEIGTIETLLWRARQALKREFTVLSESKGAMAGFLVATGAFFKRGIFKAAHKTAIWQSSSGGASTGGFRNAVAGVAVTSAAVAAAIITPQVLSSPHHSAPVPAVAQAGEALANPGLPIGQTTAPSTAGTLNQAASAIANWDVSAGSNPSDSTGTPSERGTPLVHASGPNTGLGGTIEAVGNGASNSSNGSDGSGTGASLPSTSPLTSGLGKTLPPLAPVINGLSPITTPVINGLSQTTTAITNTVGALANTLGLTPILSGLGLVSASGSGSSTASGDTTTSTTTPSLLGGVSSTVNKTLNSLLK